MVTAMNRFILLLAALLATSPAVAETVDVAGVTTADIDILPGWQNADGTHTAAIRVRLQPGWKTYWRAPGSGGIPPSFDWQGSRNLRSVNILWPTPRVFDQNGLNSIGYVTEVTLPLILSRTDPSDPVINLNAEMQLGICHDICVPVEVNLRADLSGSTTRDPAITRAIESQPVSGRARGLTSATCTVEPIADGLRVTARLALPQGNARELAVFELADQSIWVSEATTTRQKGTLTATADLVPANASPFLLNRSDLRITVLGRSPAVEILGCPAG